MTTTAKDLRDRIIAIEGHILELEGERSELSYAAMFERDAKAAKRVGEINTELARLGNETVVLNAALDEAGRRDAAAKAAERDGQERDNATKALALLDTFAQRGAALDEWFDKMIAEYTALCSEFRELEKLGFSPTTYRMVAITMRTAMLTKLMGTDLKIQHLAPGDRKTFQGAIESWSAAARARAETELNRNKAAKDAA
jgi:hypothetical protein